MPTARELLEQADALMRRNRERVEDAAIPELTDMVPESALEEPAPPVVLEDVPERAKMNGTIESASISESILAEGEPSVWLDEAALGAESIIGTAPDSIIAVVPESDAPRVPEAAPEFAIDSVSAPEAYPIAVDEFDVVSAPEAHPIVVNELDTAQALEPQSTTVDEMKPWDAPASTETVDAPSADPFAIAPDESIVPSAPVLVESREAPSALWIPVDANTPEVVPAQEDQVPMPVAIPDEAISQPSARGDDMARWEALAEEIRMQVLQRIDIFTDTGLKEQLNERLQPLVDRASAELVGTISMHVGQLLRAYVAEAIEREIEKWRAGGG